MPSILPGIKLFVNERYATQRRTGSSLACAIGSLDADAVISYGDLLFRSYVLRDLVESQGRLLGGRGFIADGPAAITPCGTLPIVRAAMIAGCSASRSCWSG